MSITYAYMESIVPNAAMRKRYTDGDFRQYLIRPNGGYVMHDKDYDLPIYEPVYDEFGNWVDEVDTGRVRLGYRRTEGSVGYFYDWTPVEMLDEAGNTVLAYGERQFFCKPIDEVPADQIFGVTQPRLRLCKIKKHHPSEGGAFICADSSTGRATGCWPAGIGVRIPFRTPYRLFGISGEY